MAKTKKPGNVPINREKAGNGDLLVKVENICHSL